MSSIQRLRSSAVAFMAQASQSLRGGTQQRTPPARRPTQVRVSPEVHRLHEQVTRDINRAVLEAEIRGEDVVNAAAGAAYNCLRATAPDTRTTRAEVEAELRRAQVEDSSSLFDPTSSLLIGDARPPHQATHAEQWWADTVQRALDEIKKHPDFKKTRGVGTVADLDANSAELSQRRNAAFSRVQSLLARYMPSRLIDRDLLFEQVCLAEWTTPFIATPGFFRGVTQPGFEDFHWQELQGFPLLRNRQPATFTDKETREGRFTGGLPAQQMSDQVFFVMAQAYVHALKSNERDLVQCVAAAVYNWQQRVTPGHMRDMPSLETEVREFLRTGNRQTALLQASSYEGIAWQAWPHSPESRWWEVKFHELYNEAVGTPSQLWSPEERRERFARSALNYLQTHWPAKQQSFAYWYNQARLAEFCQPTGMSVHGFRDAQHCVPGPDQQMTPLEKSIRSERDGSFRDLARQLPTTAFHEYHVGVHPDRFATCQQAQNYFAEYGLEGGDPFSSVLDPPAYMKRNGDLPAAFGGDHLYGHGFKHWFTYGIAEGRAGTSATPPPPPRAAATNGAPVLGVAEHQVIDYPTINEDYQLITWTGLGGLGRTNLGVVHFNNTPSGHVEIDVLLAKDAYRREFPVRETSLPAGPHWRFSAATAEPQHDMPALYAVQTDASPHAAGSLKVHRVRPTPDGKSIATQGSLDLRMDADKLGRGVDVLSMDTGLGKDPRALDLCLVTSDPQGMTHLEAFSGPQLEQHADYPLPFAASAQNAWAGLPGQWRSMMPGVLNPKPPLMLFGHRNDHRETGTHLSEVHAIGGDGYNSMTLQAGVEVESSNAQQLTAAVGYHNRKASLLLFSTTDTDSGRIELNTFDVGRGLGGHSVY